MRVRYIPVLAMIFFFLAAAGSPALAASSKGIKWYSYKEGMALAKKEGKKVYVNFHADWCFYCTKMEKETFRKSSVVGYLNDHFISISIDTEKDRKAAAKFNVRGLPDNWFFDEKGKKLGNRPGFLPPKVLLQMLEMVHTEGYKK